MVNRLLEAEEADDENFDAKAYSLDPGVEFDEAIKSAMERARIMYTRLKKANVIQTAIIKRRGETQGASTEDAVKATIMLALEHDGSPSLRRIYLNIKKYGRYII